MPNQHPRKFPNEPEKILLSSRCRLISCLINTSEIIYPIHLISRNQQQG